jgi:hypothetical protein
MLKKVVSSFLKQDHGFSRPTQWEEVYKAGATVDPSTIFQVLTD